MMIDSGEIKDAMIVLEVLIRKDKYSENEKDIKLLEYSLLGILKKNFGKTPNEKTEGLKLIEKSRSLSDEIKMIYERIKWL